MTQWIDGAGARESLSGIQVIERATTPVKTDLLARNGVSSLRILSASRFLDLLQGMVEGSVKERPGPRAAGPGPGPGPAAPEGPAADLERAYEARWRDLRSRHEESLRRIEGRMEKLSQVFHGLQGAFEGLEGPAPAAAEGTPRDPAGHDQARALLREMLLRGGE
ncbi:MAG: hypothetical protein HY721_04075 [Planctomycetes bacterium]|nr:hypothetical protein [Planctomycetota bacterium]